MSKLIDKPTLGQRRGNHAWQKVQAVRSLKEEAREDYINEARKLPIRIKASGLGQALAFIAAKAKKKKTGLEYLLADLSDWILVERPVAWTPGDGTASQPARLLEAVIAGNTTFLRWSTDEALGYLEWLNRFLDAEFGKKEKQE